MAASLKISELQNHTSVADDDLLLVTDTSASGSRKLQISTLKSAVNTNINATSISTTSLSVTGSAGSLNANEVKLSNYADQSAAGTPELGRLVLIGGELHLGDGSVWRSLTTAGIELE